MNYKLIIFDWDGTLSDSPLRIVNSYIRAAEAVGLAAPDPEAIRQSIGLSLHVAGPMLLGDISSQKMTEFIETYRYFFHHPEAEPMPLFSGVKEGLAELNDLGYWLTVATGKARNGLDIVLKEHDLKEQFIYTRCADESMGKPNPQMLFDILDYTGLDVTDALMIGDTTHDINMANNAKMAALAVDHGAHDKALLETSNPLKIVNNFQQVMDFIKGC